MKSILNIEKNIFELENILNKKQKIEELESSIQQLFSIILKDYPYLNLPTFSIIPTRALEFMVWYQDPNAITATLLIKQNSFTAYLWRCDDEKWYLDDLYSEPREIASKLIKNIPAFYSIPENPKEVKHLLETGIMHFNEILFPIFSNRTLEDSREVLIWDDHFLLVGTQLTNLKLYSHEEWNALIDRENSYLN